MGILGAAGQLFNTARKSPIAGKFMQRTGNFLQRNFNPVSAQGYKQTFRNLGPKGRANVRDLNRTGSGVVPNVREVGDAIRTMTAMPTMRNIGRGLMGAGIVDSLSKGDYGSAATEAALFAPGKTIGALKTVGRMAAPFIAPVAGALVKPVLGAGALFAAVEGLAPARVADGTLDALTPEQRKTYEAEIRSTYGSIPPSVNDDLPGQKYDPSVTLPGAPTAPYVPSTTLTPDSVPPTPTPDIGQAMDPYAYQLNVYGQGRQDAATQSSRAAVRDLGLSIHRQMYPGLYKNDGPKTPLQEPSTMNNLDAASELDSSTRAVEELIDIYIIKRLENIKILGGYKSKGFGSVNIKVTENR